jgi:hypothetical protein
MDFTQGNPDLIAKARKDAMYFVGLAGRGATAPGAVVVRRTDSDLHPFAAHFFNSQDGGYYFGDYCSNAQDAMDAAEDKLRRYDRDGELRANFK